MAGGLRFGRWRAAFARNSTGWTSRSTHVEPYLGAAPAGDDLRDALAGLQRPEENASQLRRDLAAVDCPSCDCALRQRRFEPQHLLGARQSRIERVPFAPATGWRISSRSVDATCAPRWFSALAHHAAYSDGSVIEVLRWPRGGARRRRTPSARKGVEPFAHDSGTGLMVSDQSGGRRRGGRASRSPGLGHADVVLKEQVDHGAPERRRGLDRGDAVHRAAVEVSCPHGDRVLRRRTDGPRVAEARARPRLAGHAHGHGQRRTAPKARRRASSSQSMSATMAAWCRARRRSGSAWARRRVTARWARVPRRRCRRTRPRDRAGAARRCRGSGRRRRRRARGGRRSPRLRAGRRTSARPRG